jgi:hypothetical protein
MMPVVIIQPTMTLILLDNVDKVPFSVTPIILGITIVIAVSISALLCSGIVPLAVNVIPVKQKYFLMELICK